MIHIEENPQLNIEFNASPWHTDVSLLWAIIPPDSMNDVVDEVKAVLEKYALDGVGSRKRTRRTVCKSNIREALRAADYSLDAFHEVNDDWIAAWLEMGFECVVELYDWRHDVSLKVSFASPIHATHTDDIETATKLLMEEYERYISGEQE